MSAALIPTRLRWDGRSGIARHGRVLMELDEAPWVPGLPLRMIEIDYAPSLRVAQVRESAQSWRDMDAREREAAAALLERVAASRASALPPRPA